MTRDTSGGGSLITGQVCRCEYSTGTSLSKFPYCKNINNIFPITRINNQHNDY